MRRKKYVVGAPLWLSRLSVLLLGLSSGLDLGVMSSSRTLGPSEDLYFYSVVEIIWPVNSATLNKKYIVQKRSNGYVCRLVRIPV